MTHRAGNKSSDDKSQYSNVKSSPETKEDVWPNHCNTASVCSSWTCWEGVAIVKSLFAHPRGPEAFTPGRGALPRAHLIGQGCGRSGPLSVTCRERLRCSHMLLLIINRLSFGQEGKHALQSSCNTTQKSFSPHGNWVFPPSKIQNQEQLFIWKGIL